MLCLYVFLVVSTMFSVFNVVCTYNCYMYVDVQVTVLLYDCTIHLTVYCMCVVSIAISPLGLLYVNHVKYMK